MILSQRIARLGLALLIAGLACNYWDTFANPLRSCLDVSNKEIDSNLKLH